MDLNTRILITVVTALAMNYATRVSWLRRFSGFFYAVQFMNIGVGSAILWFGMPGFAHMPAVKYMLGLLFFWHVAQNQRARVQWLRSQEGDRVEQRAEKERRLLEALVDDDAGEGKS